MREFEIEYISHDIIMAEDFNAARRLFVLKHNIPDAATCFYDVKSGEKKEVIGHCEMSELPIFEGEKYTTDGEVMWLDSECEDDPITDNKEEDPNL
jgi:hypothetical protein